MEILEIKKEDALKAFEEAGKDSRKLLKNLFGEKVFIKDIKERVKTIKDAFEVTGRTYSPDLPASIQVEVLVEALNEGWYPDYNNSSERKYYPWWKFENDGFRLLGVFFDDSDAGVGAPFVYKSDELVRYAATQFTDLYNKMLNPKR